ncbi:hypothetical protein TNCV_2991081 [Trichonephila clavipes]|nr:hypothetical protein TNCV_2991081 [Trichonephila clavipes]
MSKPNTVFCSVNTCSGSSRDWIRRVGLQHGSMIEHLVKRLKTSPNHIGLGSALETGGWQFINQHGYMRGLNQVNLARLYRSKAKRKVFFTKTCCCKCRPSSCRYFSGIDRDFSTVLWRFSPTRHRRA